MDPRVNLILISMILLFCVARSIAAHQADDGAEDDIMEEATMVDFENSTNSSSVTTSRNETEAKKSLEQICREYPGSRGLARRKRASIDFQIMLDTLVKYVCKDGTYFSCFSTLQYLVPVR